MKASASELTSETVVPAVHLEFIQNQLENSGSTGPEEVETYHRALFFHHHAVEWEKYRQQIRTHEERLVYLEERRKCVEAELAGRAKHVPVVVDGVEDTRPALPWNGWDRGMFAACVLGILCLIGFGVWNVSFNLLESGLITFRENPWRAYLWAALLPVGALGVKLGWDFLHTRARDRYLWGCLMAGLAGVFVWVAAYACVYPTLSKGINEHIATLSVFDSGAGSGLNFASARWVDVITVAAQATAEIFLSAVMGIYLTSLYGRHRRVRLAVDPGFAQASVERRELDKEISRERTGLAEATGRMTQLENQLTALIAYGKSLFHREAARRQDATQKRQLILDQLSDHLRHHLETGDTLGRLSPPAPVAQRGNGS